MNLSADGASTISVAIYDNTIDDHAHTESAGAPFRSSANELAMWAEQFKIEKRTEKLFAI